MVAAAGYTLVRQPGADSVLRGNKLLHSSKKMLRYNSHKSIDWIQPPQVGACETAPDDGGGDDVCDDDEDS